MVAPAYVVPPTGDLTAPNGRNGPAVGRENVKFMPSGIHNKFLVLTDEDVDGEHVSAATATATESNSSNEEDIEQHVGAAVQPPHRSRRRRGPERGRGHAAASGRGCGVRRLFLVFVLVAGAIAPPLSFRRGPEVLLFTGARIDNSHPLALLPPSTPLLPSSCLSRCVERSPRTQERTAIVGKRRSQTSGGRMLAGFGMPRRRQDTSQESFRLLPHPEHSRISV